MQRVTGIGGIFFKAKDAPALQAWYKRHLGIDVQPWGGAAFTWTDAEGKPAGGTTIWSVSAEPFMCVARLGSGIAFGSPYGDLTDLFFLICCHTDRQHLQTLARLVRMLDSDTVGRLREVPTPEEALAILIEREEVLAKQFND